MTEQERRINDLEEELRALKMSEGMSGGGRDLMFRNQVEGSGGRRGGSGCGGIVAGARSKGSSAENGVPEGVRRASCVCVCCVSCVVGGWVWCVLCCVVFRWAVVRVA